MFSRKFYMLAISAFCIYQPSLFANELNGNSKRDLRHEVALYEGVRSRYEVSENTTLRENVKNVADYYGYTLVWDTNVDVELAYFSTYHGGLFDILNEILIDLGDSKITLVVYKKNKILRVTYEN
ncbi:toxin co-regulated pilus biosynthesis Q family protein [Vibrio splendidus]|uniref:toxin co-regulated pilus biosynthesis Q family protein n=1 Tax=Vibrio splendidus TaxID=29497 RepID=UPI0021B39D73|nr:toxin co-regulated pilus biosynthesis Q family protein [Vibrio splendidus]UWZ98590.1 TcpQ domain-containing protein [Vibrio splendidus]